MTLPTRPKQRYRAESIARTELAFAYNRGAHESVRQAVSNGLMGVCEKVWETAGSHRTCGRCMELNGKVVGFDDKFFDSKYDTGETPPLHPRCRCVIIYREIEGLFRGLSSGNKIPLNIENTPPKLIGKLSDLKSETLKKELNHYEKLISNAKIENAVIFTVKGEIYHCSGDLNGIPLNFFNELGEKLKGATVTHNHPIGSDNDYSFSEDDINLFQGFKLERLRGIDEKFIYEMDHDISNVDSISVLLTDFENIELEEDDYNGRHRMVIIRALNEFFGYRRWSK